MELTRLLYLYEEVELSLLSSLLNKQNLDKVLFWCYELYYSSKDNNIFPFLIKIYFDFYALKNPKFYHYITKNYDKWKIEKDIYIVGNICKNLFSFKYDINVFVFRQCCLVVDKKDTTSYKGRKPTWLSKFNKDYHLLYLSLSKRDYKNICYYLQRVDLNKRLDCLVDYFEKQEDAIIHHDNLIYELKHYHDYGHFVIHCLFVLFNWATELNEKKIYTTLNNEEKDEIEFIQNSSVSPKYKTLQVKRKYKISKALGCFQLERNNDEDFIENIRDKWLYNCRDNFYWKTILNNYKHNIDHDKKEIVFEDDDILENFYENHGYLHPDEQDIETQEKAGGKLENFDWKLFTKSYSCLVDFIEFNDNYKFIY